SSDLPLLVHVLDQLAPQAAVGQRELRSIGCLGKDDVDEAPFAPAHHARIVLPGPREGEAVGRCDLGVDAGDAVHGASVVPHREVVAAADAEVDLGPRLDPTSYTGPPPLEQVRLRPRGETFSRGARRTRVRRTTFSSERPMG